jgi:HD-like signal output (HDOD) protein
MNPLVTASMQLDTQTQSNSAMRVAAAANELELPPLPQIALEVQRLADGNASALAQLIQRDMALAGQVMRVANSALFARATPAVSLRQAIARLGIEEIRKVAFTFAVRGQFLNTATLRKEMTKLWQEALLVALFAQEIARCKRRNVETTYLCGLMHRIGHAVILWRLGRNAGPDFDAKALSHFVEGFEAQVGAQLAEGWQLPDPVASVIRYWRTPEQAGETLIAVNEVLLSRVLCSQLQFKDSSAELAPELLAAAVPLMESLSIYVDDINELLRRREELCNAATSLA